MLLVQKAVRSWPMMLLAHVVGFMPRWARWSIAAVALAMPVAAFTYGHALKQAVKAAWSRWDVRRAQPLLQNEITAQDGVKLLLGALMRSPDEPEVIRSLAQLTDEAGMPAHARFFYEHLSRSGAMTADDQLRHAAMLARLNDQTGAQVVLRQFAAAEGETPALWRTQAEIATASGDHAAARSALSKVLVQVPHDAAVPLQHAQSQALSTEVDQQHAGIAKLLDLFETSLTDYNSDQRTHCFWTLSNMPIADPAQRERFARLIERMPWKKLERRVMQRLLQATLDADNRDGTKLRDWLREMLVSEADTPAEERLAIAKMLQRYELHNLVLEWIPFAMGLQDRALCTTRLDSLIALKLWSQAAAMIEHHACPLPHELQAIMRAHLELVTTGGQTRRGAVLLEEALAAARGAGSGSQGAYVAIARLAARFEQHEISLTAYGEAMDPRFPVALFLAPAFIAEARQSGASAEVVLHCLNKRARDEAWNQDLLRQASYYRVLCGEGLELIEHDAAQAPRDEPGDAYRAFLVAFARLRLGQAQDLSATTGLPLLTQPHVWTNGERAALHAIFLAAADRPAAAAFEQGMPQGAALFQEEQRLLAAPH